MKYGTLIALILTLAPVSAYAAGRGGGNAGRGGGSPSGNVGRGGGGGGRVNPAPRANRDRGGRDSYSFGFSYNSGYLGLGGSYSHGNSRGYRDNYYRGSYYSYAPSYYTARPIYIEPEPVYIAPPVYYQPTPVYSPVYVPSTTYYYYSYPSVSVGAYYYRR